MKKVFAVAITLLFAGNIFAQDKDIRFGLSAAPSLNWYKPENVQKYESKGVGLGFGWGLDVEFKITDIATFATGLKINYDRGGLNFKDSVGYELNKDSELVNDPNLNSTSFFLLENRSYKVNYVTIPFMVKMHTNEIGYMTYFGQFGLISSLKTKALANDAIKSPITNTQSSKENLDINSDVSLFRFQLSIGGGAEYNLSGSTSIVFGLNYNLGFSNVLRKNSRHIVDMSGTAIRQNASAHNIALTVGILF
jgi:long-subunit fatty acid transport protein